MSPTSVPARSARLSVDDGSVHLRAALNTVSMWLCAPCCQVFGGDAQNEND